MNGEVLDIETGMDEATPLGSAQQIKRKQHTAPGTRFEMG
jgi:hypothetical protein